MTEYNPLGSIVVWEVMNGNRVDRIHLIDRAHKNTKLQMDATEMGISGATHPHDVWAALTTDHVEQFKNGHRFFVVGHTVWNNLVGPNEHEIWAPSYDIEEGMQTFRSSPHMHLAQEIAMEDVAAKTCDATWEKSIQPRMTWNSFVESAQAVA